MSQLESTFINAINGVKDLSHTPIWLMRQAGRYMKEYRDIRQKAGSFLSLCKNPTLATTVTLQPLAKFNLDAAILFSDILVIPDALGLGLYFVENEGPKFERPISCSNDIDKLTLDDIIVNLEYVFTTIKNVKSELKQNTPLIGFSGSPFTLLCYMIEGGSSKDFAKTKKWLYTNSALCHKLLDLLSQAIILYLDKQIESGIDTYMIFDTWGGILTPETYQAFSKNYMQKIVTHLSPKHPHLPSIVFTKGGGLFLDQMATINSTAIGLDWTCDLSKIRAILPHKTLQGNLDPSLLAYGDKNAIKNEVHRILHNYYHANNGNISSHIFNLGHGILPTTPPDNVAYLVDLVHELSHQLT